MCRQKRHVNPPGPEFRLAVRSRKGVPMKKMPRESTAKSKKQKKKDPELINGNGMTRRTALKLGAVSGAAAVITSRKSLVAQVLAPTPPPPPPPPPEPTVCSPQPTHSPATTPFVQALPIPPVAQVHKLSPAPTKSANTAAGEAPRADHQRWEQFLPQQTYDFTLTPANHTFHPDLGPTYCWTYNGIYPGPTIINQYGIPVVVRFHNNLPVDHNGFGSNTHTTHLHNGHTASESDGFAGDFWGPGFFKDHHYPNIYAGLDTFGGIGDPREAMRTFWYHDHRHSFTATNNYRGLNGMYLLYDNIDTGQESGGDHNALHLPGHYGLYDLPLNFTGKKFCPYCHMFATAPDAVP